MKRSLVTVFSLLLVCVGIQGCATAIVGGAAATAAVFHDRRTFGVYIEDQAIEFKAAEQLASDPNIKELSNINVTSYNMVVLMTGQAANQQLKTRAESLVTGIERVRRVVNEVEIGSTASLGESTHSAALTAEIKFTLTNIDIPGFDPLRVKVITERGVVYLMGLLTESEGIAVADLVSHISGVRRVVKVFEYL
jgi:osmotically-inducible protein OsmY